MANENQNIPVGGLGNRYYSTLAVEDARAATGNCSDCTPQLGLYTSPTGMQLNPVEGSSSGIKETELSKEDMSGPNVGLTEGPSSC